MFGEFEVLRDLNWVDWMVFRVIIREGPSSASTLHVVPLMSLRASLGNSMEGYMLEVLNLMLHFIF